MNSSMSTWNQPSRSNVSFARALLCAACLWAHAAASPLLTARALAERPSAHRKRCDIYVDVMDEEKIASPGKEMLEEGCRRVHIRNKDHRQRDPPGVVAVLRLLDENPKICETVDSLDLHSANLGRKSLEIVAKIVSGTSCPFIDVLYIANNNIGSEGAAILADAILLRTTVLNCINIGPNNITNNGAIALADALKINDVIEELFLDGNPDIGRHGVTELNSAASQGRMQVFFGEGPPMAPGEAVEITQMYKRHVASEHCREGAICRWPSCRLLHALRLIGNETGEACAHLSVEMKSFGVVKQASADKLIEFLKDDPGGLLALAGRRARIKTDVDAIATAGSRAVNAAKAVKDARAKAQTTHRQVFINVVKEAEETAQAAAQHYSELQEKFGRHRHFLNHSLQQQARTHGRQHEHSLPLIESTCYAFSSKPHDYLLKNTFFYPDARSGTPGTCSDAATATLLQHLQQLSEPTTCVNKKQVITGGPPFGFGSTITSWVKVSTFFFLCVSLIERI
jgi:hypothetical protein